MSYVCELMFVMEKLPRLTRKRKMNCWTKTKKKWKKSHIFLLNSRHRNQSMSMDVMCRLQGPHQNTPVITHEPAPNSHSQSTSSRCFSFKLSDKLTVEGFVFLDLLLR